MLTKGSSKFPRLTLDLCTQAAEALKGAGFVLHIVSLSTEACYYRWPDRPHLLRVAEHSKRKTPMGMTGEVVSKITFNGNCHDRPGYMQISDDKVKQLVAQGIGWYFLRSSSPPQPVATQGEVGGG